MRGQTRTVMKCFIGWEGSKKKASIPLRSGTSGRRIWEPSIRSEKTPLAGVAPTEGPERLKGRKRKRDLVPRCLPGHESTQRMFQGKKKTVIRFRLTLIKERERSERRDRERVLEKGTNLDDCRSKRSTVERKELPKVLYFCRPKGRGVRQREKERRMDLMRVQSESTRGRNEGNLLTEPDHKKKKAFLTRAVFLGHPRKGRPPTSRARTTKKKALFINLLSHVAPAHRERGGKADATETMAAIKRKLITKSTGSRTERGGKASTPTRRSTMEELRRYSGHIETGPTQGAPACWPLKKRGFLARFW